MERLIRTCLNRLHYQYRQKKVDFFCVVLELFQNKSFFLKIFLVVSFWGMVLGTLASCGNMVIEMPHPGLFIGSVSSKGCSDTTGFDSDLMRSAEDSKVEVEDWMGREWV